MNRRTSRKTSDRPLHRPNLGPVTTHSPLAEKQREERRQQILWSAVIGGGLLWAVWPEEESGRLLLSKGECSAVTQVSTDECEAAYDRAAADHERLAPRFDSAYQCNEQFGTCHQDPADSTYWMPPMAGFLLGYRERDDDDDGSSGGSGYASGYRYTGALPLYRERGGDYLNPHGDYVGSNVGKVTGTAGRTAPPARAITVSRSGFGSTAGARSSFGG